MAERVKAARKAAGLTQAKLAQLIGKDAMTISRIERGETSDPDTSTIEGIAMATGKSVEWLRGVERPEPTYEPVHDDSRPMVDQLLDVYRFGLEKRAWVRERLPEIAFSVGATPSVVAPAIEMLARQYDAEEGGRISPPERERVEEPASSVRSIRKEVLGKSRRSKEH